MSNRWTSVDEENKKTVPIGTNYYNKQKIAVKICKFGHM